MGIVRVLIVGSGGREHALAWGCRRDAPDTEVIVAPGNAGTASIAENVALDVEDAEGGVRLALGRRRGPQTAERFRRGSRRRLRRQSRRARARQGRARLRQRRGGGTRARRMSW